jgi:hypothetical protein
MSYLGFTRSICRYYLSQIDFPKVLEIGVDKGQTAIPLIQNLCTTKRQFMYAGIDVLLSRDLIEQIGQFENMSVSWHDDLTDRVVMMFEENSLDWLGNNQDSSLKFDLILIDGDHNYYTVFNELNLIQAIIKPTTLIVCDDFQGRYSEKDMFYSEREEYKDVPDMTPRKITKKSGIRSAVIDFRDQSPLSWRVDTFGPSDPCFLYQEDFLEAWADPPENTLLRDMKISFSFKGEKQSESSRDEE